MNINNLQPFSITRVSDQSINKNETPTSSSISSIKEHELSKIAQDYQSVNDRETSQSSLSSVKELDLKKEGIKKQVIELEKKEEWEELIRLLGPILNDTIDKRDSFYLQLKEIFQIAKQEFQLVLDKEDSSIEDDDKDQLEGLNLSEEEKISLRKKIYDLNEKKDLKGMLLLLKPIIKKIDNTDILNFKEDPFFLKLIEMYEQVKETFKQNMNEEDQWIVDEENENSIMSMVELKNLLNPEKKPDSQIINHTEQLPLTESWNLLLKRHGLSNVTFKLSLLTNNNDEKTDDHVKEKTQKEEQAKDEPQEFFINSYRRSLLINNNIKKTDDHVKEKRKKEANSTEECSLYCYSNSSFLTNQNFVKIDDYVKETMQRREEAKNLRQKFFLNSSKPSLLTHNNVEKTDDHVKEKTQKEEQTKDESQESFLNSSKPSLLINNNIEKTEDRVKEKTQKEELTKDEPQKFFIHSYKRSLLINNNVEKTDDDEVYLPSRKPLNPYLFCDEINCTFADYLSKTLYLDKIQDKLKIHKEIFSTVFNTYFTSPYSATSKEYKLKMTTSNIKFATAYFLLEQQGFSLKIESEQLKINREALVFKAESREPFINKPLTQFKKRPEEPSLTVLHIKKNGSNDLMEVTFTFRLTHRLKCEIPVACSFNGKWYRFQTTKLSARLEVEVDLDPEKNALHEMQLLVGNQVFIIPVFVMFYD